MGEARRRREVGKVREGQVHVLLVFDDGVCRSLTATVDAVTELAESPVPIGLFAVRGDEGAVHEVLAPLLGGGGSREESLTRILAEAASELREELSPFLIHGAMS